ncbi:YbaB/EbfC family nucleoid-associated protein [Rickettsiales bacterium]|nr:YbaB/EbfC family nucleoid-associated protein [Rickettsiales bacterium]
MNIQQMMKQAQAMQKKMAESQEKLANTEYYGTSGGDMIKVTITGKGEIKNLKIDPSLIDPSDPEMLEDLIVAAFNNAKKEADSASNSAMSDMMGGMGLPPGFKLPF